MSTRRAATLGFGLLVAIPAAGAVAFGVATAITVWWMETKYLPRIAGED